MGDEQNCVMPEKLRIFSGSSNPLLAEEIAGYLACPLCKRETERFSNDNLFVHLCDSVRGKEVVIVQSLSPNASAQTNVSDSLLELLMMLDAARSASAKTVHAVIPYYSYARSDKKDGPRISIAGRLVADLVATAGANHVMTMELHSPQVHGFFSIPTDHLSAHSEFVRHFRGRALNNAVILTPDIGHAKRASELARALGFGVAAGIKERLTDDTVKVSEIIGDIEGKHVIIFDDEIATGGSILEIVKLLRPKHVRQITLACTHGVFSGQAAERLRSIPEIDEIVTTNTVPIPPDKKLPNMRILSVARIFGEAIRRNLLGQSVGPLLVLWPTDDEYVPPS